MINSITNNPQLVLSQLGCYLDRLKLRRKVYCKAMLTDNVPKETIKRYYRVDRREIAFLKFVIEAYEGLAMIETLNPELGIIGFYIAPGCESDVDMILRDLKGDIMMESVNVQIE